MNTNIAVHEVKNIEIQEAKEYSEEYLEGGYFHIVLKDKQNREIVNISVHCKDDTLLNSIGYKTAISSLLRLQEDYNKVLEKDNAL